MSTSMPASPAFRRQRDKKEIDSAAACTAAAKAREVAAAHDAKAVELRTKASGWRNDKRRFPHTEGTHVEVAGTLDGFVEHYQTAERLLASVMLKWRR
jgi:hypothetical protein